MVIDMSAALEERRLHKVYDHFDIPDYKRALQECDKLIKRHGSKMGPTVLALRALALTKLGKWVEANKLLDELVKEQPTEEATLAPMVIALREIDRKVEIIPLYESACKLAPSEELLNSLFMLYVKERDRTKAKTIALKLHKMTDKRPYYFTAVMHQYLCGKEAIDDRQKKMCFTLAEKMFDRMPPNADAELMLQYMILRDSGKLTEALQVMQSSTTQLEMLRLPEERFTLLQNMNELEKAAEDAEKNFEKSNFSDHVWLQRILDLSEKRKSLEPDRPSLVELSNSLLEKMDNFKDADKRREIILNKIVIYKRLGKSEEIEKLIFDFYKRFQGKIWCTTDVLFILKSVDEIGRSKILEGLEKIVDKESFFWYKVNFQYGVRLTGDDEMGLIEKLSEKYRSSPELQRASDNNEFDSYLELAADMVVERFKGGDDSSLKKLLLDLELAKKKSPNGFKLKLRLLWCYCLINDGLKVTSMVDSLNIKYLQSESLGYMIGPFIGRSSWLYSEPFCQKMIALHTSSQKDLAEGIVNCYKCGSFHKIEEMEELKPKLENSYELANAKVLSALLMCFTDKSTKKHCLPSVGWTKLQENYDMTVLPESYHFIFDSLETKKRELHLRWFVLRILVAADAAENAKMTDELRQFIKNVQIENPFEYFLGSLFATKFEVDFKEKVDAIVNFEINSVTTLRRFIHFSAEMMMAFACLWLISKKEADRRKLIRSEFERFKKKDFANSLKIFNDSVEVEKQVKFNIKESFMLSVGNLDKILKN